MGNISFSIPISFDLQPLNNLHIVQKSILFTLDHPFDRYIWYTYRRGKLTFIDETSYILFFYKPIQMELGRNYIPIGNGKMSGLFISPTAPSLDHFQFKLIDFHGLSFSNTIIRLDNRQKEWDGDNEIAQRWYYIRSVGYKSKKYFQVNLFDAVISTGFNRGLEWYYLNPLASLFMERKHELHWLEGGDSTSVIGIGDNDNHFVGGDWLINLKNYSLYGEWLIDEWQLSPEYRPHMQTVFGFLFGFEYRKNKWSSTIEYSYASPWLYLSRGLYASPEKHYQPLGLRSPQSHSLDLQYLYYFDDAKSIIAQAHFEERGDQSFYTKWNAWDNKIDNFDFSNTLPIEFKLMYIDKNNKYFNKIGIYHNWLQSGKTSFIIGWDFALSVN